MYYLSSDHLGSINLIVDGSNGNVVDDLSYDSWGRNRNPIDWSYSNITLSSITDRGYTSHEQLTNFGLINMNGRIYDPMTLGFLSPDPFVQNPSNSQNFNRFSYVLNNPLKYVDPSGYMVWDPWFETMINGNRFFKEFPEMFENFRDKNGNLLKLRDDMKFSDENGNVFLRKIDEGLYVEISKYQEIQEKLRQYNSKFRDANIGFIAGAGVFRVEGEGNGIASNGMENWVSDVWNWAKNHFYIGAEGEITYGLQLSGIVYKGVGLNINPVSQIVTEGKISNRDNYTNSYPIMPANRMNKGRALDFGAAYIFGVNYNLNMENGKHVSSTLSIGAYGIGGNLTWNKSGISNIFVGFELGGKVAVGWGIEGVIKIGFNWDW